MTGGVRRPHALTGDYDHSQLPWALTDDTAPLREVTPNPPCPGPA